MHKEHPLLETLPLQKKESVIISVHSAATCTTSLHYHPEYEIILITNCEGVKRTTGDITQEIAGTELILLGPNLYHKWLVQNLNNKKCQIVSIHINPHFFEALGKKKYAALQNMLDNSLQGILFPAGAAAVLKERLVNINTLKKKEALKEVGAILRIMAKSDYSFLCQNTKNKAGITPDAAMEKLTVYLKKNYNNKITLEEACSYTGKSLTTFNRFIRKHTGTTFTNYLSSIRAGFAARNLIETTQNVAAIAELSGFNNLAYFNRTFKKKFGMTPLRYREAFYGKKKYI